MTAFVAAVALGTPTTCATLIRCSVLGETGEPRPVCTRCSRCARPLGSIAKQELVNSVRAAVRVRVRMEQVSSTGTRCRGVVTPPLLEVSEERFAVDLVGPGSDLGQEPVELGLKGSFLLSGTRLLEPYF